MMDERPLTDGTIALLNLDAQIDALSGRQSSKPSAVTTNPLFCEKKPRIAGQALNMSQPWSGYMPSAAKSRQQNGGTRKAAAGIVVFHRFLWRFLISSWDSCG
jgi:hypothetical protein